MTPPQSGLVDDTKLTRWIVLQKARCHRHTYRPNNQLPANNNIEFNIIICQLNQIMAIGVAAPTLR